VTFKNSNDENKKEALRGLLQAINCLIIKTQYLPIYGRKLIIEKREIIITVIIYIYACKK